MTRACYTRSDIERVTAQFPNLWASGFHDGPYPDGTPLTDEDIVQQVSICAWFLKQTCAPTKTYRQVMTSYGWKHVVENAVRLYVCNGAFIAAAILAGYRVRRVAPGHPNAVFNMRVSSAKHRAYIDRGQFGWLPHVWES
jgi:hypothetical protein